MVANWISSRISTSVPYHLKQTCQSSNNSLSNARPPPLSPPGLVQQVKLLPQGTLTLLSRVNIWALTKASKSLCCSKGTINLETIALGKEAKVRLGWQCLIALIGSTSKKTSACRTSLTVMSSLSRRTLFLSAKSNCKTHSPFLHKSFTKAISKWLITASINVLMFAVFHQSIAKTGKKTFHQTLPAGQQLQGLILTSLNKTSNSKTTKNCKFWVICLSLTLLTTCLSWDRVKFQQGQTEGTSKWEILPLKEASRGSTKWQTVKNREIDWESSSWKSITMKTSFKMLLSSFKTQKPLTVSKKWVMPNKEHWSLLKVSLWKTHNHKSSVKESLVNQIQSISSKSEDPQADRMIKNL